jgi:putative transposase
VGTRPGRPAHGIAGLDGARRGRRTTRTTTRDTSAQRHPDRVNRAWTTPRRPDQWWCADVTYVWTLAGFAYVSFVTDVYSRRILGWRVSTSKTTPLVMSALEQALFTRRRDNAAFTATGLVHHSDAGSQYTSLAFTEALIDAGIAGSIGSVGDALDNALMESTIGLYKTELIDRQRSWTGRAEVERETAAWVHWFNTDRLHSSIGYRPPVEFEDHYRDNHASSDLEVPEPSVRQIQDGSPPQVRRDPHRAIGHHRDQMQVEEGVQVRAQEQPVARRMGRRPAIGPDVRCLERRLDPRARQAASPVERPQQPLAEGLLTTPDCDQPLGVVALVDARRHLDAGRTQQFRERRLDRANRAEQPRQLCDGAVIDGGELAKPDGGLQAGPPRGLGPGHGDGNWRLTQDLDAEQVPVALRVKPRHLGDVSRGTGVRRRPTVGQPPLAALPEEEGVPASNAGAGARGSAPQGVLLADLPVGLSALGDCADPARQQSCPHPCSPG